ncbi:hypothetical protein [Burkholderia diffusa]|uniref:hypothetical protein n=1 Tax=Burkholderia diffusa TaxID=488732 RepID=UPI00075DEDF8|nr:hypothetical protein [Burkholderia diffusa]KVG35965.1 hypothetical protein WJ30_04890 [Burkholderia diffusa]
MRAEWWLDRASVWRAAEEFNDGTSFLLVDMTAIDRASVPQLESVTCKRTCTSPASVAVPPHYRVARRVSFFLPFRFVYRA